jgi:hypothetical protein
MLKCTLLGFAQVCTKWDMYGSSGYRRQPRCIVQSFVKRSAGFVSPAEGKCVVKSERVWKLVVHHHNVRGTSCCADGSPMNTTRLPMRSCNYSRDDALLLINHYRLQAEDLFMQVKATRGDVIWSTKDGFRDMKHFQLCDAIQNDVVDMALARRQNLQNGTCRTSEPLTREYGYLRLMDNLKNSE